MAYQYPLNGGRINATIGGNTAGAGSLVSTGTLTLVGGNNVTLSQNGNAITISGGTALSTQSNQALSGSNGSFAFQTATFGNSNGLSFYTTNGSMVGSYTVPTQTAYSFSNANGVSFGTNASTVTASVATTYAASNHSHGNPTLNLTNLSGTTASASNGLTLSLSAASQSVQTQGVHSVNIGGNTSGALFTISSGALSLYGGNNVTLSQNSNNITISAGGGVGPALYDGANSITSGTARISAGGALTASVNGQTLSLNAPAQSSLSHTGIVSISRNGNTISIGAPAFSAGMSTLGNTSGTTGTVSNQMIFAGGNNITLSQSTGAGGNTISIIGGAGAGGGVALYDGANSITSGTARISAGGALTASVNGQTLSLNAPAQSNLSATGIVSISNNGNTISIGAPAFSAGMSTLGNTSGTTGTVSNQMIFAGGNNITLSQSTGAGGNTISISGADQSNQNISLYALGNTTQNSSTLLNASNLSFNGLGGATVGFSNGSIQISGATGGPGGPGGGVAFYDGVNSISSGTARISAGGALTASVNGQTLSLNAPAQSSLAAVGIVSISTNGSTMSISAPAFSAGIASNSTVTNRVLITAGNNVTLSQSTDAGGATIAIHGASGGAGGGKTGLYFDNMFQQASQPGLQFTGLSAMSNRMLLQPLSPGNELFPYNLTAGTMRLNFSNSATSTAAFSAAQSSTFYFGLYTRVNSTQLSMVNSGSQSYGLTANSNNTASLNGARWLTFGSAQFSTDMTFEEGKRYFFGFIARTGGINPNSLSIAGMHLGASVQRSGDLGAAASSNTSHNAWHPFMGVYGTTVTSLPVSVANSQINKASNYANFIPHIILDAGLGAVN